MAFDCYHSKFTFQVIDKCKVLGGSKNRYFYKTETMSDLNATKRVVQVIVFEHCFIPVKFCNDAKGIYNSTDYLSICNVNQKLGPL